MRGEICFCGLLETQKSWGQVVSASVRGDKGRRCPCTGGGQLGCPRLVFIYIHAPGWDPSCVWGREERRAGGGEGSVMGVQTGPTPGPAGWAPRILGTSQPAAPKPVLWSHLEVPSPFYGVFSALKTPQWPTQPCWGSSGHFHQKKKKKGTKVWTKTWDPRNR